MIVLLGGTTSSKLPCGHGYMDYEGLVEGGMRYSETIVVTETKCKQCKKEWLVKFSLVEYRNGKVSNNLYRVQWRNV